MVVAVSDARPDTGPRKQALDACTGLALGKHDETTEHAGCEFTKCS